MLSSGIGAARPAPEKMFMEIWSISSARTVSYTHLEMLLRIEDLDPDRCTREKAELLMDDLTWLGLTWDEGPRCV